MKTISLNKAYSIVKNMYKKYRNIANDPIVYDYTGAFENFSGEPGARQYIAEIKAGAAWEAYNLIDDGISRGYSTNQIISRISSLARQALYNYDREWGPISPILSIPTRDPAYLWRFKCFRRIEDILKKVEK